MPSREADTALPSNALGLGKLLANSKSLVRWRRGTIPQAPEGAADYKSAPLPIRVTPPRQKPMPSKSIGALLETGAGVEPDGRLLQGGAPFHTAPRSLANTSWHTRSYRAT